MGRITNNYNFVYYHFFSVLVKNEHKLNITKWKGKQRELFFTLKIPFLPMLSLLANDIYALTGHSG